jgi:organic hydroperoxide reductase OsmC/OhrA
MIERRGRTRLHRYQALVTWTGNQGTGTSGYKAYGRSWDASAEGKPAIPGSSDPLFRGDAARWNPEDLLIASVAACHQLWYLHLCAEAGVVVTSYEDHAEGVMAEEAGGEGQFEEVTLRPRVTLAPGADADLARQLHHPAHEKCFIARSVNFPIKCEPEIIVGAPSPLARGEGL